MNEIEKVKSLMESKKMTQLQLGKMVGLDQAHVSVMFKRGSIPKQHIKKVANALGVTADYLLD